MQFRKAMFVLAVAPVITLVGCKTDDGVKSYYLEVNPMNVKLDYYVGERFDPTGLIVNQVTLVNGNVSKSEPTTNYTFDIDLDTPLTEATKTIQVLSTETKKEVLPGYININVESSIYPIGYQQNLKELYPGYSFTSSNNFVGRIRLDGVLETYREGTFKLVGQKKGSEPIFLDIEVKKDADLAYPNYEMPGAISTGVISELGVNPKIVTNSKYRLSPKVTNHLKAKFEYEVSNPKVGKIEKDPNFDTYYLLTGEETGETRIKITMVEGETRTLAYDIYANISNPYSEYEVANYLAGTNWVSVAFMGEKYTLNFLDAATANLTGISSGSLIQPIDFTFQLAQPGLVDLQGVPHAKFICYEQTQKKSVSEMYVHITGNDIKLYDASQPESALISFFELAL